MRASTSMCRAGWMLRLALLVGLVFPAVASDAFQQVERSPCKREFAYPDMPLVSLRTLLITSYRSDEAKKAEPFLVVPAVRVGELRRDPRFTELHFASLSSEWPDSQTVRSVVEWWRIPADEPRILFVMDPEGHKALQKLMGDDFGKPDSLAIALIVTGPMVESVKMSYPDGRVGNEIFAFYLVISSVVTVDKDFRPQIVLPLETTLSQCIKYR